MNPNKTDAGLWLRLITADGTDDPYRCDLGGAYVGRDGRSGFTFPGEAQARREAMESNDRSNPPC